MQVPHLLRRWRSLRAQAPAGQARGELDGPLEVHWDTSAAPQRHPAPPLATQWWLAASTRTQAARASHTAPCATTHEVAATEALVHGDATADQRENDSGHGDDQAALITTANAARASRPAGSDRDRWQQLEERIQDVCTLLGQHGVVALTRNEQALVQAAMQEATAELTDRATHGANGLEQVKLWLLELAVKDTPAARKLALVLLRDVNFATMAATLAMAASPQEAESLQRGWFRLLLDMLARIKVQMEAAAKQQEPKVTAATAARMTSAAAWLDEAVLSLTLFVYHNGEADTSRLLQLDPAVLVFLLKTARTYAEHSMGATEIEEFLVELTVLCLYEAAQATSSPTEEPEESVIISAPCRFALPRALVDQFGGLDWTRFYLFQSASSRVQQLLFCVLFDVACDTFTKSHAATSNNDVLTSVDTEKQLAYMLWYFNLPQQLSLCPLLLSTSYQPRLIKTLLSSDERSSNGHALEWFTAFLPHLQTVLRIDDQFVRSADLSAVMRVAQQQPRGGSIAEGTMRKVDALLQSSMLEERARGEQWLAELLVLSMTPATPGNKTSSSSSFGLGVAPKADQGNQLRSSADELEDTCVFDEAADMRLAARSRFWQLAKASVDAQRLSAVATLSAFVRRKLRPHASSSAFHAVAREVSTFLTVLHDQRETSVRVLTAAIQLVLRVCVRPCPSGDAGLLAYDRSCGSDATSPVKSSPGSRSLAQSLLAGELAVDQDLLRQFPPAFVVHVVSVLDARLHPQSYCRGMCCGEVNGSDGDLLACAAWCLTQMLDDADDEDGSKMQRFGGMAALLSLVRACDTRVAVFAGTLVARCLRSNHGTRYMEALRQLHAQAAEQNDLRVVGSVVTQVLHAIPLVQTHGSPL